jgi:hypothetical protein
MLKTSKGQTIGDAPAWTEFKPLKDDAKKLDDHEIPERIAFWIRETGIDLEAVFGPGTEPGHISFCAHSPDTCGCTREFAWSRASHEDTRVEVPVSSPKICEAHSHLWQDMHDHHHSVLRENQHKNIAYDVCTMNLPPQMRHEHKDETGAVVGYSPTTPLRFFYSDKRELHWDLDHIAEIHRAKIQDAFDREFKSRRTFVKK